MTEDTVQSAHGSACDAKATMTSRWDFGWASGFGRWTTRSHVERNLDLGCGSGASGSYFSSKGV